MTTKSVVSDEQLGILARRQHDLFRRVREGTLPIGRVLDGLQCLIEGQQIGSHVIDCDAAPFVPNGWILVSHKKGGVLEFDPSKILLHQEPKQKNGGTISGIVLQERLADKTCLNACVLDYLLAHTNAIPESWKEKDCYIYFFGTVYSNANGGLCVRCLYWGGGKWRWNDDNLVDDWGGRRWVAILAS